MFQKGKSYRRLDIHEQFGGRQQSGISNCPKHPYIFIWTKRKEEQDVYEDKWEDNYYLYSGEGRIGDQKFTGGNKSIRDHKINGKTIFLFEKDYKNSGYWIFINEMSLKGCYNYKNHDELGNLRTCIRFQLKPLDQLSAKKKKDNPNIFIFTAGDKNARSHLDHSVNNRIPYNTIKKHINTRLGTNIKLSDGEYGGTRRLIDSLGVRLMSDGPQEFYAWGAIKGPNNLRNWNKIKTGDWVLCVYDNKYQYISKITGKVHNKGLATDIWGTNEKGDTWEYMYFFERPNKIELSLDEIPSEYMYSRYLGFTSISDERIDKIDTDFFSIEKFIQKYFSNYDRSFVIGSESPSILKLIRNIDKNKIEYKKLDKDKEKNQKEKNTVFENFDENKKDLKDIEKIISSNMSAQENSRITFEANDSTLGDSFFGRIAQFVIPRYQRPYSWGKDEINDFWNDLNDKKSNFFIGSVIFNTRNFRENSLIEVIDGQQRLLTSTIFCRALHDVCKEFDAVSARDIESEDFFWKNPTTFETTFKIYPGDSTFNFFRDYIQQGFRKHQDGSITTIKDSLLNIKNNYTNEKVTPEERRIYNNYHNFSKLINNHLSKFKENEQKTIEIGKLRGRLRQLGIVEIKVTSDEAAYEIFETTNARGLDLSVTDLLKNYIFRNIPMDTENGTDLALERWNIIIENIEKSKEKMSRFIRYFWLSRYGFVETKKLFRAIKENTKDWKKLLKDLEEDSEIFKQISIDNQTYLEDYIQSQENKKATKHVGRIVNSIKHIRKMNISQHKVFVMSVLRNLKNLEYDPTNTFEALENFCYMFYKVCAERGVKVEKLFSQFAVDIQENSTSDEPPKKRRSKIDSSFRTFVQELKDLKPDEESFKGSFRSLKYNDGGDNFLISYTLQKIDMHLMGSSELSHNIRELSVEHILPQNPVHWGFEPYEVEGYVHNIGNLTLLDRRINGRANNYRLIQQDNDGNEVGKLSTYQDSELNITKRLVERINDNDFLWNEEIIVERTNYFADLAFEEIWNF